ncbi:MAG: hypothetical protein QM730_08485 [Anaerolineales bacterium]
MPATILVEGCVVLVYSALQKKPAGKLLLASFVVNVVTQSMLWLALKIFFQQYLVTLFVAEVLIWLVEGVLLYYLTGKQLTPHAALILSLCMNAVSFGVGWFLPV